MRRREREALAECEGVLADPLATRAARWSASSKAVLLRRGYANPLLSEWLPQVRANARSGDAQPCMDARFLDDGFDPQSWQTLRFPSVMTDAATLRLHHQADWTGTPPLLRAFVARYVERLRKRGVPLYVHSAFVPAGSALLDGPAQRGAQVVLEHVVIPSPSLGRWERSWLATHAAMALDVMRRQRKAPEFSEPSDVLTFTLKCWRDMPVIDVWPDLRGHITADVSALDHVPIRKTPRALLRDLGNGS